MTREQQDADELAARWSELHHGIDPREVPLTAGWLRGMWAAGRVLDRLGVRPTTVTVSGVGLAVGAVTAARECPRTALALVVASAVCDGLDGATAVVSGRVTRSGAIADAVADRVCDGLFAAVLWRRGAPGPVALAAASSAWGVDGLRRVRTVPAKVTVAERPTFAICAALACATGSVTTARWPARVCAAVWLGAGAIGLGQVARARRD